MTSDPPSSPQSSSLDALWVREVGGPEGRPGEEHLDPVGPGPGPGPRPAALVGTPVVARPETGQPDAGHPVSASPFVERPVANGLFVGQPPSRTAVADGTYATGTVPTSTFPNGPVLNGPVLNGPVLNGPVLNGRANGSAVDHATGGTPSPVGAFRATPGTRAAPVVRRARPRSRWVVEWALVILVAVLVAFGMRTFVVQTFYIPSASMEPTLMIGDRILVDKLSYHLHSVHRGDVVVFGKPPDETAPADVKDLVKRVIGLPGDRISSQAGRVYIDGKPLEEPWLSAGTVTTGIKPLTIPANEYFVMGDNRSDSQDSRFFGPIARSLIVGRVVVRIWPLSALHIF